MNRHNDQRREWMVKDRICKICGKPYNNQTSLGRLACLEHPGTLRNSAWTCCGLRVSSEIKSAKEFYNRPFSLENLGCVACDHKDTLTPYSTMPYTDYREIRGRLDGSTVLVFATLITNHFVSPVVNAIGNNDPEFVEVYRYSRPDLRRILDKSYR
jgi:hypothetical protein